MHRSLLTEGSALIDGNRASARVLAHVAEKTRALAAQGLTPGLSGRPRRRRSGKSGLCQIQGQGRSCLWFHSIQHDLPATTSEADLLALINTLMRIPTSTESFAIAIA